MAGTTRDRADAASSGRLRRWLLAVVVVVALAFGATGWFDRSRSEQLGLEAAGGVVIVNDAGPVTIRSRPADGSGVVVTHHDSWLWSGPVIEAQVESDTAVVRVRCRSWTPCRSSVEVSVPDGRSVSVTSLEGVDVGRFEGALEIFAGDDGVVAGPVLGSLRVLTTGPILANALEATDVDLFSSAGITLGFERSPDRLSIVGSTEPITVDLPNQRFRVEIDSPEPAVVELRTSETSDRRISVRSDGPITLTR